MSSTYIAPIAHADIKDCMIYGQSLITGHGNQ